MKKKKRNHNETYLLSFIDVNNAPYHVCATEHFHGTLQCQLSCECHCKAHRSEFREKGIECFRRIHHELFF